MSLPVPVLAPASTSRSNVTVNDILRIPTPGDHAEQERKATEERIGVEDLQDQSDVGTGGQSKGPGNDKGEPSSIKVPCEVLYTK
ncbi:hypothetical protein RvY_15487 [Ramazzottius varieornatus]|uniref:Uncharacterized protein n=1 Tax=Ramazzottius varieornatus TaxID=947166 RepID=A0A1D1VZQ8_RAMVA|nr:hypothetical protein RvY_15487 [Ramazzottius varieornatus]